MAASLPPQIAKYGYVLQTGRIVLSGPAALPSRDPAMRGACRRGERRAA